MGALRIDTGKPSRDFPVTPPCVRVRTRRFPPLSFNGTMFDNTTIIYMPGIGAGHHSPDTEAPMVLMTGRNSRLDVAGRYWPR